LRDSTIPVIRLDRQRAEETEAAPVGDEIRADQFASVFGGKDGAGIGEPAGAGVFSVAHERARIGHPEKRAKRDADNAIGGGKVALNEWANQDFGLELRCRHESVSPILRVSFPSLHHTWIARYELSYSQNGFGASAA
jgi:hypothetical protein